MKVSELIHILAGHLVTHGDHPVYFGQGDDGDPSAPTIYKAVTHCWWNYGPENEEPPRVVISDGT